MRLALLAAASAFALAACGDNSGAPEPAAPAAEPAAANGHESQDAHAGHGPMDHAMADADAADDANTDETPHGHTFHTYPAKIEQVHLPAAGAGVWSATVSHAQFVSVGAGADQAMPDGTIHYVVRVEPKASGNADVVFERRDRPDGPVTETRTVHFMVH